MPRGQAVGHQPEAIASIHGHGTAASAESLERRCRHQEIPAEGTFPQQPFHSAPLLYEVERNAPQEAVLGTASEGSAFHPERHRSACAAAISSKSFHVVPAKSFHGTVVRFLPLQPLQPKCASCRVPARISFASVEASSGGVARGLPAFGQDPSAALENGELVRLEPLQDAVGLRFVGLAG